MRGKAVKQFIEGFEKGYGLMSGFMRNKEAADATNAQVENLAPVSEIQTNEAGESTKTDVAPQQYKLLGKTFNEPLTDQQISTERNRAIASSYKRWGDPAAGMKLENDLLTQERENTRFADERKDRALKDEAIGLAKQRDKIVAGANKPAGVAEGFALDGQAGGAMAFNSQGNANTVLEGFSDVVKPEVKPAAWTDRLDGNKKLYTGLNAAVQAKQYNDGNPITSYSRYRNIYDQLSAIPGMGDEADKYLAKIKTAKSEGAFDVLSRLERGDVEGAYAIGNQLGELRWPEGSRLVKTGEKSGESMLGYSGAKYSLVDRDGRVLADDIATTVNRNILGPEKVAEITIKAAADARVRADKLSDAKELKLFGSELKTDSAGTGSSGGRGKAPKTPAEQLDELIKDTLSRVNGQSNPLTLDQGALLGTVAQEALKLNPNIDPRLAVQAGLAFAQNPVIAAQVWKPELGSFVEQVETPQGFVAVNKVTFRNAEARNLKPEQLKQAVESSISSIAGTDATKRQKVIAAAFDNTGVARRALLDEALVGLRQMPQFKALSPQGQAEALKNHELSVNQALSDSLGWITNFGQDLSK